MPRLPMRSAYSPIAFEQGIRQEVGIYRSGTDGLDI